TGRLCPSVSAFQRSRSIASPSVAPQRKILAGSCSKIWFTAGTQRHKKFLVSHFADSWFCLCLCDSVVKSLFMPSTQLETGSPKLETDLRELAEDIVRRAMRGGATAAECVVREGDEFSTLVRLGQVETLKESGSRSIGVRVFNGQRAASTYSSDFSPASLDRMLKSALELSKITSEDPFAGLPEASQLGSL